MNDFGFYLQLGWEHIISIDALDHQLFIISLAVLYTIGDWKKVLILVTAFTIGHSLTLALSTLNIISVPSNVVEFIIPCTIVITAVTNILKPTINTHNLTFSYCLALFFGLIHGLGFANTLKFIIAEDQSFGWSLVAFNIGLELGQVLVVLLFLLLASLLILKLKVNRRYWVLVISGVVLLISLKMVIDRFPT